MEEQSVNRIKRIDFTSMPYCKPCKPALQKVKKLAKKYRIPLNIKDGTVAPVACIVKEKNGVESRKCVEGYGKNYKREIQNLIRSKK